MSTTLADAIRTVAADAELGRSLTDADRAPSERGAL